MLLGRCFPVLGIPGKFGYNPDLPEDEKTR